MGAVGGSGFDAMSNESRDLTNAELPPNARAALEEFARHLAQVQLPPLSRFVLFGSYARGDYREDSDLDVAVVFEGAPPSPGPRLTQINELLVDPADAVLEAGLMPLSPIAVWETELGDGTSLPEWPFYRNVVREGIDLGALRPRSEGRVCPPIATGKLRLPDFSFAPTWPSRRGSIFPRDAIECRGSEQREQSKWHVVSASPLIPKLASTTGSVRRGIPTVES